MGFINVVPLVTETTFMGHRVGVIPLGGMEVFEVVPWVYGGTTRGILGYGSFTLVGVSAIAVIPWVSEATFRGVPVLESSSVGGGWIS